MIVISKKDIETTIEFYIARTNGPFKGTSFLRIVKEAMRNSS
jgi:hypothetical protein